jgi:hypothetical protein
MFLFWESHHSSWSLSAWLWSHWLARTGCMQSLGLEFSRNDKLWLSYVKLILIPFFRKLIQAEKCMETSGTTLPQSIMEILNQWTRRSTEQTHENAKTVDFLIYETESLGMEKNGFPGRCGRPVWKYYCDSYHAQWHEKVRPVLLYNLIKQTTLFSYNISYIKNWNDFDQILYSKSLHVWHKSRRNVWCMHHDDYVYFRTCFFCRVK